MAKKKKTVKKKARKKTAAKKKDIKSSLSKAGQKRAVKTAAKIEYKKDDMLLKVENRMRALEKEVAILRQISVITNKEFDINKLLGRFLDIVMEATETEAGSMLLVDKQSDTLYFAVAKGSKAHKLKEYRLALGEGIAGWVAQSGKPLITPDVKKDRRFNPKISKAIKYKTRNIICVPLKFEEEVLGVIELLNKHADAPFDEGDLEILQAFIPYISVLIKNAQLFLERRDRIHQLEHLMELTKYVNSSLNLDALLDAMLNTSTNMLNAEAGSILLLDDNKNELVFSAATGEKKEGLKKVRVPVGEGIAGWVARENKAVLVPDAQNDPRFFKKADQKTAFKTKSIIAVPLRSKDSLIGVVEVLNKKNNELFNEDDVNILGALANQAGVAFENAKLYENLRELFLNTVKSLANAIEAKDNYTRGHSERVTLYSVLIAEKLGLNNDEVEKIRLAALLHDVGKIGIDESIIRKPARLTVAEYEEIKKHPSFAVNILESIPQLTDILPAIKHHHERYDGTGYPDGLASEDIPYFSRIIAVADTYDAMSSSRPYRDAVPVKICLEEIKRCSGTQFDPVVAMAGINALKAYNLSNKSNLKKSGKKER